MSLKAFEVIPVIERFQNVGEKSKSVVECMDCSFENLYVGTSDCFVFHYIIEEATSALGNINFLSRLQRQKHLGMGRWIDKELEVDRKLYVDMMEDYLLITKTKKKGINQMLTCPAALKLLILCDGNLYMLTMNGLEMKTAGGKEIMKGVTAMARNERPKFFNPYSVEVCVGTRKKALQIIQIDEERVSLIREISVSEPPSVLAIDGQTICTALGSQYFMLNYATGKQQELFPFEAHDTKPLVKGIGKEEFLLSGPTNTMGMIVSSDGLSQHQPLSWADGLSAIGHSFPYLLVLGNHTITVHSMLDQKQKQAISFQGGVTLGDYGRRVYVTSQKAVYCLNPIPLDSQIQMLLLEKRVDEALDLSIVGHNIDPSKHDDKFLTRVKLQAGFVYFSHGKFKDASELFMEGKLDVRELVALYPGLIPADVNFQPSRPSLHNIKDITTIAKASKTLLAEAKKFLLDYLVYCREFPCDEEVGKVIDTALVKLYAECNHHKLVSFVSSENSCSFDETVAVLGQYKRWYSLGLFHYYHNSPAKSLEIWKRLADGEDHDPSYPGMEFLVTFFSNLADDALMWSYMPWLCEKDQVQGTKVFTTRTGVITKDLTQVEKIVQFLAKYPIGLRLYLEYLVIECKINKEKYHTHLAVLYTDDVFRIMKERIQMPEKVLEARKKLQNLLQLSTLYRVSALLSKLADTDFHLEIATLYGKMDQHDKALKILVHKLKDYRAAENYCEINSKNKEELHRRKLFFTLLAIYLQKEEGKVDPLLTGPAIDLLSRHQQDFDSIQVLEILPEEWSVGVLSTFISGVLRNTLHDMRTKQIASNLARGLFLEYRYKYMRTSKGALNITDERYCDVCQKSFTEPALTRYPNGVLCHIHCAREKTVCPVTGRVFKSSR